MRPRFLVIPAILSALALSQACTHAPVAAPAQPAPQAAAKPVAQPAAVQAEAAQPLLDPALPAYQSGAEVSGEIASIGSDSMDPLIQLWADDFRNLHPKVSFRIVSKGSATAPRALVAGQTLMGQMSRPMNAEELASFQAKFGYAPTELVVAVDALALYVNESNPLARLRMEQVDAIFGRERRGGYPSDLRAWDGLGLDGAWQGRAIQPYGRDENSGTRAFFKEHVLKKGEYRPEVKALADQFATVEAVASDPAGIAYGPIQHQVRGVRAVPVVDYGGSEAVVPTTANILSGRYPLKRFLYVYVNKQPGQPLPPALREFLAYVLSRNGQSSVATFGAIPIRTDLARRDLDKLS